MSEAKSKFSAALNPIASATVAIAGVSIIGMAVVQGWQVFARYVLNSAPSWTEPMALFFMATTMMFGAAAGVRSSRHFGFFILVESARPPVRRMLRIVANLIAACTGLMLAIWGGEMMIDAWDYRMAGAPLPQGFAFMPLCVGGALIALFAIERVLVPLPEQQPAAE
ncbi:TRAP-type C4-dicarboxylate transport system permease small subunit [Povalibacter uvarum]|uniref:TRAP transporter small permease protein n=1 Tax=Povalibacter uvarum TaxID=732238 RepID=A0A841HII3_9GAMM|nr:TRAP transporter small permease [Povalibacter uvarum]MBB6092523.1 TRAP-type C4-dicarboxylate transport system permease small subunit [Povalibacter uvarum]